MTTQTGGPLLQTIPKRVVSTDVSRTAWELSVVLDAALANLWSRVSGRVVGHPPAPGEKLKGREEAETFGNRRKGAYIFFKEASPF